MRITIPKKFAKFTKLAAKRRTPTKRLDAVELTIDRETKRGTISVTDGKVGAVIEFDDSYTTAKDVDFNSLCDSNARRAIIDAKALAEVLPLAHHTNVAILPTEVLTLQNRDGHEYLVQLNNDFDGWHVNLPAIVSGHKPVAKTKIDPKKLRLLLDAIISAFPESAVDVSIGEDGYLEVKAQDARARCTGIVLNMVGG